MVSVFSEHSVCVVGVSIDMILACYFNVGNQQLKGSRPSVVFSLRELKFPGDFFREASTTRHWNVNVLFRYCPLKGMV